MHLHLPAWVYQALAAIGGIGFILQQIVKPMLIHLKDEFFTRHDQPVWKVVKEPKPKVAGWTGGQPFYDATREAPYSLEELTGKVGRSRRSILNSLTRLEKRGKVKELHGGWQRKET